ncbi:MAG: EAL domain-containing protein [Gallionella sp.]|nr:EAL domain-containing protein [Gallionella sp.]
MSALLTAAFLVFNIYFTQLNTQWTLFLAGVLLAASLAETTRLYRAEWIVLRRTTQLSLLKSKLAHESLLRKQAELELVEVKQHLHLMDSVLPTMIVLVDLDEICHYHNRAFLEWLHLRHGQVEGKHLREVFGVHVAKEIASANRRLLSSHSVQYQREQTMPDGSFYKLAVTHVPKFDAEGKLVGFYMLMSDITRVDDVRGMPLAASKQEELSPDEIMPDDTVTNASSIILSEEESSNRMKIAIEKGEFRLFSQLIRPLSVNAGTVSHYEVLIRLLEEEENMMPPGAFFPLAEKYGLMPNLDRWVVQHVIEWVAHQIKHGLHIEASSFFINISDATISAVDFSTFVERILQENSLTGEHLCFQVSGLEWVNHQTEVIQFMQRMRQVGCRIALSGFGQELVAFGQLTGLPLDFVKIDGSIILELLRDPDALAQATAIEQFALEKGIKTIAEFVEYENVIDKLKGLGIDYVQGFGISHPVPLEEQFAVNETHDSH